MKTLLIGVGIVAVLVGGYFWMSNNSTADFPYTIKDGKVYCADGSARYEGTMVGSADAATFRRPTQAEYDNAVARDSTFMIDAVDKNNSFYRCSRVNFSGTI
jgi:hypothetical protein